MRHLSCLAAFAALTFTATHAADSKPLPPPVKPERVEVTATRVPEDPNDVPASVDIVTVEDLRARGATDLSSALSLLAGIDVAPGGDNGPASSVPALWGLKEFDAFLLVVDGVPHGGAFNPDLASLPLEDVERFEVVRGPAPVMYGATSFVGVIQVVRTPAAAAHMRATVGVGSYGSGRAAYATPLGAAGSFHFAASGDLERRGLRDDRAGYDRARTHVAADGKTLGGTMAFDLDAAWLRQDPSSPHPREGSVLSPNVPLDANHNPGGAYLNERRVTATGRYDRRLGGLDLAATVSASRTGGSTLRGFLVDVSNNDPNANGFRQATNVSDAYLDVHLVVPAADRLRIVTGIDHLHGRGSARGGDFDYFVPLDGSNPPDGNEIPSAADVIIRDKREFSGLYANAEWKATDRLRVDFGGRLNRTAETRYTRAEEFGAGVDEGTDRRGVVRGSGAVGLVWTAWRADTRSVNLYGSVRSTFKPAAIDFGLDADTEILQPETAMSYETGAKADLGRLGVQLSVYQLDFDNVVVSQIVGGLPALENAGSTRFRGAEVSGTWRGEGPWHVRAAYSLQDARFRDYLTEFDGTPTQLRGKRFEMTPRDMASAGFVWAPVTGFGGSAEARWVGARWLNKRNTALAPDYVTWSAGVRYRLRGYELRLDGRNLNNQRPPISESELGDAEYYRLPAREVAFTLAWSPK